MTAHLSDYSLVRLYESVHRQIEADHGLDRTFSAKENLRRYEAVLVEEAKRRGLIVRQGEQIVFRLAEIP